MKLEEKSLQLVIKQEIESGLEFFPNLSEKVIHVGLGHTVFNVTDLMLNHKDEVNKFLEKFTEEKYYFRMSFVENLTSKENTSRCYLTHDAKFFKPKVNKDTLYFLGLNFVVIEMERLGRSKNFNIDNHRCTITKITIDPVTGDVTEEVIWEKTKFGRIESYLPNALRPFASPVYQCRRRLMPRNDE